LHSSRGSAILVTRQVVNAKVLLVEDSDAQGHRVSDSLERMGYTVLWARSGVEGLKLARTENPDVILLDVVMADIDGFSVCRWLKMHADTRDIPIIMLTVKGELEYRIEGLNVGANDYLPKPFADAELEARVFAALRVRTAQAELKERNQQLEAMLHRVEALAITDPLTGLFNRRRFTDVLKREFALTKRYGNPLSCLMIDLDHFKQINDTHGHEAGDQVLKEVAHILAANCREVDLPTRYGGEEFVVLLPHTAKPNAGVLADRLAKAIKAAVIRVGPTELRLTASFGAAATTDVTSNVAEDLVRAADAAMFRAKREGRDRVALYVPEDDTPLPQGLDEDEH
jgi:two-component system, cell cycle response regulator